MNKKNFRIRRSAKMNEMTSQSQLLQKALQRIVGGRVNTEKGLYNRLAGLEEQAL